MASGLGAGLTEQAEFGAGDGGAANRVNGKCKDPHFLNFVKFLTGERILSRTTGF